MYRSWRKRGHSGHNDTGFSIARRSLVARPRYYYVTTLKDRNGAQVIANASKAHTEWLDVHWSLT